MGTPDQKSIDHWLVNAKKQIKRKWELFNNGFYEENDLPHQGLYNTLSDLHADLGRALFLNKSSINEVRKAFSEASEYMLKNFKMTYDESDPDYQGKNIDWSEVSETDAMEGMNYALIATNFELAKELGLIYQDRLDGHKMDIDANRYAHALASFLKGKRMDAWGLLRDQLKTYDKKPPKSSGNKYYYSLITALFGIIDSNEKQFNEGLSLQLKLYESDAKGELKDTDEEFICDDAVALANLGLHHGLKVTVEHDTLPKGLLIELE